MFLPESYLVACLLLTSVLSSFFVSCQKVTTSSDISKAGDAILDCSDIANLSEIAQCLAKRFASVRHRASAAAPAPSNQGYPFRVASLPTFLRHEPDHPPSTNSIEELARRNNGHQQIQRRIQGYNQPTYRNYFDLDSTLQHRTVEYRPVFRVYDAVPLIQPTPAPYYHPLQETFDYYTKPVKTHGREYNRRRKQGKLSPTSPNSQNSYDSTKYHPPVKYNPTRNPVEAKKHFNKNQNFKYNTGYVSNTQYTKENNYDTEYYVPANSPIMGDIRRSLMDYTGARDLMEDETDYFSSSGLRRFRVEAIQQDYYPFRRSDSNVKDLQIQESKTDNVTHKKSDE